LGVFYDPSATPIAAPALAAGQVAAVPEPSGIFLAIICGTVLLFLVPRLRLGTH
jgi:hypothetical protein